MVRDTKDLEHLISKYLDSVSQSSGRVLKLNGLDEIKESIEECLK